MADSPEKRPRDSKPTDEVSPWALAGLGTQFFAAILLFVYAGNWLDRRLDTAPWFLLGGVFFGGGGAFYASYRQLTKPRTRDPENDDSNPNA